MRIFVEDSFDAAHWLPNVPVTHKCHNMHGHTYRVRLELGGDLDVELGWVIDYAEVKGMWDQVKARLDHRCLNDVIDNPTCEHVALFIQDALSAGGKGTLLERMEIRETEHCGVVWERE